MTLDELVAAALAGPPRRVRALDLPDGRRFWLKRVEVLSWPRRVQKGDPVAALVAEREGLRWLATAGLPVAEVVMAGEGWMVLADAGPVLPVVVADPGRDQAEKLAAFIAAGRALGRLHQAGLVHGRPAMRDICWDGHEARFIDLERFRPDRKGRFWQAADVLVLAQTAFTLWHAEPRWIAATLASYATHAPEGAMRRVRRLTRWLGPLGWLARPLYRLRPQSRELRAVGVMLAWLGRWGQGPG